MTTPNRLEDIAEQMRSLLASPAAPAYVQRNLFGGLFILLQRRPNGGRRLAIARTDKAPSSVEAETIASAFRLPAADWSWTTKTRTVKAYIGRGEDAGWREVEVTYKVAECFWRENG